MLSEDSLLLSSRAKSTFFYRPHTLLLFFLPHLFMVIFILPGLSFFSVRGPFQCSVSESVALFTFLDQYFFFFLCSLYCMFENCYKYVPFKSHLCTGTAEDQLKPAYEKRCNHEYAHAAFGNNML